MDKTNSVQEKFLCTLIGRPVSVIVVNGFHVRGYLTGFDSDALTLEINGAPCLVRWGAVSTVKEDMGGRKKANHERRTEA